MQFPTHGNRLVLNPKFSKQSRKLNWNFLTWERRKNESGETMLKRIMEIFWS